MSNNAELLSHNQKYFVDFRSWWKTSDPAWLKQRKAEWKSIKANIVEHGNQRLNARELRYLGHVYVTGEEYAEQAFEGARVKAPALVNAPMRFILTPFTDATQASALFDALSTASEKESVLSGYLSKSQNYCHSQNVPSLRQKIQAFVEGVLGNEYKFREAASNLNNPRLREISPSPGKTAKTWLTTCRHFLSGEGETYSGNQYSFDLDIIPYALSCLRYIDSTDEEPDEEYIVELVEVMHDADSANDLTPMQQELLDKLHVAFRSTDAPEFIRSRYKTGFSGNS